MTTSFNPTSSFDPTASENSTGQHIEGIVDSGSRKFGAENRNSIYSKISRGFTIGLVTTYLLGVLAFLLVSGRLKGPFPLRRVITDRFRKPFNGPVQQIRPDTKRCFIGQVASCVISDRDGYSRLVVLEDGRELREGHAGHDRIRNEGRGLYSHWGNEIFFSSSDNSDPSTTGRLYTVEEHRK